MDKKQIESAPSDSPPISPDLIVRQVFALSLSEIALGSLVHGFKIPLGGHALSLNQGAILTWTVKAERRGRRRVLREVLTVAHSAAFLKALSPMGNRLAPMFAISFQGLLYAVGVATLGANVWGSVLGLTLLSLWGFLQPVVFAVLFFGKPLIAGFMKAWGEISRLFGFSPEILWPVLSAVVAIKVLAAGAVALLIWRSDSGAESRYLDQIERLAQKARPADRARAESPARGALRDLCSLPFLASAALSVGFLAFSGEAGAPEILLYAIRTLAGGLCLFWALRSITQAQVQNALRRFPKLADSVARTLSLLKRSDRGPG